MKRFFSILLIISLVCSVALFGSGTAFAASGDTSGDFGDFVFATRSSNHTTGLYTSSDSYPTTYVHIYGAYMYATGVFVLPGTVLSGNLEFLASPTFISTALSSAYRFRFIYSDADGNTIGTYSWKSASYNWQGIIVPAGTAFIIFEYQFTSDSTDDAYASAFNTSCLRYSNFVYDTSSDGSNADLSTIESLLSYSDQTYTTYSGAYDWSNHQFSSTSTWSDFGSAFQSLLYSNSGAAILLTQLLVGDANNTYALDGVTYNNLPSYLIALGNKLSLTYSAQANTQAIITSRFNSVDSDLGVLLTNSAAILAAVGDLRSGVSSALYADYPDDTDANKAPWSVAEWLRGIYSSLSGFISGFWSSGETAVKNAAESAYTATSSSGLIPSGSNVSDFADVAFDVKAIVSFGGSAGAAFDMYGNGDLGVLGFFTQDCMDCMDIVRAGSASLMDDDDEYSSYHANQSAVSNYLNNH